ncbi:MAG TPA: hypothetical protein VML94_01730 [Thermoplasmata archaeon]|nr:hypothetical protein [Thermoplasmata archaeon]
MPRSGDRYLGAALGLVGAVLLFLEAFLDVVRSVVYFAVGHTVRAFGPIDQAAVLVVIGIVVVIFSALGGSRREDRSMVAGVVLVVLALIGWLLLGFGTGVLALLASILILIAGIVFLVSAR